MRFRSLGLKVLDYFHATTRQEKGPSGSPMVSKQILENVAGEVKKAYSQMIDPMRQRCAFEERPADGEIEGGPLVLIVGNHSSGKSTFLNHILQEDVQRTGMAPTDDCFTILRFGEQAELGGMAIVSNPDLPFSGLGRFGPDFLAHFRMKLLPIPLLRDVTLIDTPGMIDAADSGSGRGYDFSSVVRAIAERADVVFVFFDPDRPGTTAESLTVLTTSLAGFDHKLQVVMNKMDQFRSMRDFARCYGALCWNLGKVIKKKDIPQIYTTYVPVAGAPVPVLPLEDFESARRELIEEIRRAPSRRVDNMINQASHYAERLRMHSRIVDQACKLHRGYQRRLAALVAILVLTALGTGFHFYQQGSLLYAAIASLTAVVLGFISWKGVGMLVRSNDRHLVSELDKVFEDVYRRDLVVGNRPDDLLMMWEHVRPLTRRTLENLGIDALQSSRSRDRHRLDKCIEDTLPNLRAQLHRDLSMDNPASQDVGHTFPASSASLSANGGHTSI